jgi:uncharacterized membrane protein
MALGLLLLALFVLWLGAAHIIWLLTLGPEPPVSLQAFAQDVLTTRAGWTMAIVGVAVGFVFALAVLVLSVVSFPLLLDRDVGVGTAIATSVKVVRENPGPMALWGVIIAVALLLGSIPLLLGLAVRVPGPGPCGHGISTERFYLDELTPSAIRAQPLPQQGREARWR